MSDNSDVEMALLGGPRERYLHLQRERSARSEVVETSMTSSVPHNNYRSSHNHTDVVSDIYRLFFMQRKLISSIQHTHDRITSVEDQVEDYDDRLLEMEVVRGEVAKNSAL